MTSVANEDFANCELSVDELETIAAGFSFESWIKSEVNPILNELELIMGTKYHPPLPSGGPGPKGGPYRV